jgi:predicted acylesterase/phospholipase RssA
MRALSLPGCGCRGAFQFAVLARLFEMGERFDVVAGASSGSISGACTVAGLAAEGPSFVRGMMSTPIVSSRYLKTELSPFGMGAILRDLLGRYLPEERLFDTEAELLVATTHASRYARGLLSRKGAGWEREGLVVHSNRSRRNFHDVIVASCYIPVLYAGFVRIDGDVHVDGGAADNTLIDVLVERGATEITVVTPYPEGAVSRTVFSPERPPSVPRHVRLRLIYPERRLSGGRFDFSPASLEEALTVRHVERVIEPGEVVARAS